MDSSILGKHRGVKQSGSHAVNDRIVDKITMVVLKSGFKSSIVLVSVLHQPFQVRIQDLCKGGGKRNFSDTAQRQQKIAPQNWGPPGPPSRCAPVFIDYNLQDDSHFVLVWYFILNYEVSKSFLSCKMFLFFLYKNVYYFKLFPFNYTAVLKYD